MNQVSIPRPEYPRPQLRRDSYLSLNGPWEFEMDAGMSGKERRFYERKSLSQEILVPFCPESELSGIGNKDFMQSVWYLKKVTLPWQGGKTILHFGACDYETDVWVNGKPAGTHIGGYSSFSFDITGLLQDGENIITVNARDDVRSGRQPRGKQSSQFYSHDCDYTRTTGIWQSVWLENVPYAYIKKLRQTPDVSGCALYLDLVTEDAHGLTVTAQAFYEGKQVGKACASVEGNLAKLKIDLDELHLWETGCGRLYELRVILGEDCVDSYFGMRSISYADGKLLLNGKPVFQRLVLDQGFYPDGIYTAPSDDALRRDIELSMDMGFNGARLHQKIFEERYLYHADRLGYLVWGEHGNWGLDISGKEGIGNFAPEWVEAVERDYSHPALIGWCPFNETQKDTDRSVLRFLCHLTKALDPTRPCIDSSGWHHTDATDLVDLHDYEQNPDIFRKKYDALMTEGGVVQDSDRGTYGREMTFVSEYGGIKWDFDKKGSGWGYGDAPKSEVEFLERYRGLTTALLQNRNMCAFCYTQLTDVEQEINGLYTYDRRPKFDPAVIRAINTQTAAIEEEENAGQ